MPTRLLPFSLVNSDSELTTADQVTLDTSGFSGNLDSNTRDIQDLADTVDGLTSSDTLPEIGAFTIDIAPRVDLDTNLNGSHTVRFRVYNHQSFTGLSLFVEEGGLFSTFALATPTGSGTQTQTVNLTNILTSSERTLNFYLVANSNTVSNSYIVRVEDLEAADVDLDDSALGDITANNVQEGFSEVQRLFGIVRSIQNEQSAENRPLAIFNDDITITDSNIDDYINRNNIYGAARDKRVNFLLPTDAHIATAGTAFPVILELQHFGGTARFDSGPTPTNTVVVDTQGTEELRTNSATGTVVAFSELHRGDTAIVTKSAAGQPWVIIEGSVDPRTSILPDGVFQINSRTVTLPANLNGDHVVTGLSLYTPNLGDAFEVTGTGITEDSTFGRAIEAGDVIVAKQDNPSLILTSTNEDWLIIRDAGHGELTLTELRFLAEITETDRTVFNRLEARNDVTDARIWMSPYILDHAPFITPSTDPDNPQSGETGEYIGGDELDSDTFELRATTSQLGTFVGGSTAVTVRGLLYVRVTGSFDQDLFSRVHVLHRDIDGNIIDNFPLSSMFRSINLLDSVSNTNIQYFVFDDVAATDNFSSINYHANQTLELVEATTERTFSFSDAVNLLGAIADGSIDIEKLDSTVQALIRNNQALSSVDRAKLDGLTTDSATSAIDGNTPLYVKLDAASSTNDLSHYVNVRQLNGIVPDYERVRNVFFLIPTNIQLTGLRKVDDTSQTLSVTFEGNITTTNNQSWLAYSAALPAITGANSVFDNVWELDGNTLTTELTGAEDTFKINRPNLSDDVVAFIRTLVTPSTTPPPSTLPENLQQFARHLSVTTDTTSGWSKIEPNPIRAELTRQFAALWDENRRTFTGNYFQDITGVVVGGYNGNNIFFYDDPNNSFNTSFPGAQSYILNSPVRINNASGQSAITDSFRKVISFNYALQRALSSGENVDMLKAGNTSTPLIGLSEQEGLYLNIGRGDGGQRTRTVTVPLSVIGGHWHDQVDQVESAEAEIVVPQSLTGSLTVTVSIQLDDDGNDEGTHTETFTITNLGADQTIGNRTFNFSGFPGVTTTITYEHSNNDLSTSRRVIFLRPTQPFTNAALTYNVAAHYDRTETWNVPTTYARFPINAGSGHTDFGLFDPHLYDTEHVHERNRVILEVQKYQETDNESDPELAVRVVVDGQTETSNEQDNLIRLHRPASDFEFDDITFGDNLSAIAHIQCYNYSGTPPSSAEMQRLYAGQANWLNAYYPPGHAVDDVIIDANLEVSAGHGFILAAANGTRYLVTLTNDGAVETNTIT